MTLTCKNNRMIFSAQESRKKFNTNEVYEHNETLFVASHFRCFK